MWKIRIVAILILIAGILLGYWVYTGTQGEDSRFRLGLDLSGGSYLIYKADTSAVASADLADSLDSLREVIERRVNLFGVAEPVVQLEKHKVDGEIENRLIVELPGITDVNEAIDMIGQTPLLEFKTEGPDFGKVSLDQNNYTIDENGKLTLNASLNLEDMYIDSGLTGRFLNKATLQFTNSGGTQGIGGEPIVGLSFNSEGAQLFQEITRDNIGKTVAIYLDGSIISAPVVNTEIAGGQAVIEGNFTPEEAKDLVTRLNSGALPVPIHLISVDSIGPSLGTEAVKAGIFSAVVGFLLVALILLLWYRLPGLIAILALLIYGSIMLALFQLVPVTLTAAGIAGFIISIGIAVDANILIFERMKEEMSIDKSLAEAIKVGFARAWSSIRDSNISSIISAVILFWFGSSLIEGFALTFGIGVLVSMLTAITITKMLLMSLAKAEQGHTRLSKFLYGNGFRNVK